MSASQRHDRWQALHCGSNLTDRKMHQRQNKSTTWSIFQAGVGNEFMHSESHGNALTRRPFFSLKTEIMLGKHGVENPKV